MDVAELYMRMIRPNGVPVVGECMADGFIGSILVEKWTWSLVNDDESDRMKEVEKTYARHDEFLGHIKTRDKERDKYNAAYKKAADSASEQLQKELNRLADDLSAAAGDTAKIAGLKKSMADLNARYKTESDKLRRDNEVDVGKLYDEKITDDQKLTDAERKKKKEEEEEQKGLDRANRSYEFSFSKRVDFATTQMLNSMKAGDVFPLVKLTINQRSSNAGMMLEFTVTNLRLVDYSVHADVTETMTDMKEQWKATFHSLAYLYQNRKSIENKDSAREAVTKVATQGTVRTFAMKKDLGI
jgi:type VI protein secretion system component Hcp